MKTELCETSGDVPNQRGSPERPVCRSAKLMKKPRAFTFTTLLVLAVYLFFAGSGWPVGLCCVEMGPCAEAAGPSHDCADPCREAPPTPGPCASLSVANHVLTHSACECSFGPLAGPRYYLPEVSAQQTYRSLQKSTSAPSLFPAISSAAPVEKFLIPPQPAESERRLACLSTVTLVC